MRTFFTTAALGLVLVGCGSKTPQVHRHMPKIPTQPVAVGAVAAAAALTLANPNAAATKKEDPGAPGRMKLKNRPQATPATVLERLDEAQKQSRDPHVPPKCRDATKQAGPGGDEGRKKQPDFLPSSDGGGPIEHVKEDPTCIEADEADEAKETGETVTDKPADESTSPAE